MCYTVSAMDNIKNYFQIKHWEKSIALNLLTFFKWIIFSAITGIIVGLAGSAFHHVLDLAGELRTDHLWLILLLPAAGLIIVFLYHVTGMKDDKGTEFIMTAVRDGRPLKLRTAPLIFTTTALTHLTGGSAGREGAALQLGGSISAFIGKFMKLDEKDERVIVMAGMSAGFAALFGTPLASAIFAMEVVSVGVMYYAAIVPCILSALIARIVASMLHVQATAYNVTGIPAFDAPTIIRILIIGLLCAGVSVLFCFILHFAPLLYNAVTKNPYIKVLIGSGIMLLAVLLVGTDYCGAGGNIIENAVAGSARPEAFILKIILTAVTLSAGFKGGEIVPTFFTGATFGCVIGPLIGLSPSFAAAVGIVSVFCGVTNCPLTSIVLAYELFGGQAVPLFALSCAVAYMMSGYWSLYGSQKVVYSKMKAMFVNKETH